MGARRARKTKISNVALTAISVAFSACAAAPPNDQRPRPAAVAPSALPAVPTRAEPWSIEDFEQPNGTSGGFWFEFDKNPLGTKAEPNPFKLEAGGALGSSSAAHIYGVLGSNRQPWTWVQLQLFLDRGKQPQNLAEFKSLRFWAKGDGGRYGAALVKRAVKNYDHFHYEFTAPREWTEFRVPLTEFTQAGWGEKLPRVFDEQPSMLGAWPAAALLFHRHDGRRAKIDAFLKLDPNNYSRKTRTCRCPMASHWSRAPASTFTAARPQRSSNNC